MRVFLSLKTKTILIFLGALVGTGFLIVFISVIYFNILKERLVEDAVNLAREQGERVSEEIHRLIEEENVTSLKDVKNKKHFQTQLQILLKKNNNIVVAGFVDSSGRVLVQHRRKGEDSFEMIDSTEKDFKKDFPVDKEDNWEIEVKKTMDNLQQIEFPIKKGELPVGYLRYSISQSKVYQKIAETSKKFTYRTVTLLSFLIILLAVIFYLLWKIFNRHIQVTEERDRLDKMAYIGTLASGLAHEIRNPLNVMRVNLDVLSEEIEDTKPDIIKQSGHLLKTVSTQVEHLNDTLDSFLKFAIQQPLKKETTDLVLLLRETLDFFENDYKRKGIICLLDSPETLMIDIDPNRIKQVLTNILVNSIQAMDGTEKKISINLFKKENSAIINITDTGPGFPPDKIEECFNVFFSTKEGGSGFGLAIARKIVEEHNGTIKALNVEPHGARISISLPI